MRYTILSLLLFLLAPLASAQDPAQPAPKSSASAKKKAQSSSLGSQLKKAETLFKENQRAKSGGLLLEIAEMLEKKAGSQKEIVLPQVEALREAALEAARGNFDSPALHQIGLDSVIRLALVDARNSSIAWNNGQRRNAGELWASSLQHLEATIEAMDFGLKDAGRQTLESSRKAAQQLNNGEAVEPQSVIELKALTTRMIHEVGRNLAQRTNTTWPFHPADF